MRLNDFENPMFCLAKKIIAEWNITYTRSLGESSTFYHDPNESNLLAFSNLPIPEESHYPYHVLAPESFSIPGSHTVRDLFFLIHNILYADNCSEVKIKSKSLKYVSNLAVIGCDGIGLFNLYGRRISIIHTGGVVIGNGVEIGQHTCVARGVLDDTVIEDLVRIGYNCNIGHGSIIGENTTIVDGATLGGSCKIGKDCWIGMNCTIREGVKICNDVLIGMGAVVTKTITLPGKYYGNPAKRHGDWDGRW